MASSLATTLTLTLAATYQNPLDLVTPVAKLTVSKGDTLASGTAADQASKMWSDTRTLTATHEDLDLGGVLTDCLTGATMAFAKVRALLVHNKNTTTGQILTVGPGTASGLLTVWGTVTTSGSIIDANGLLFKWAPTAGYAVTTATGDLIRVDAGTCTIVYDIVILGT